MRLTFGFLLIDLSLGDVGLALCNEINQQEKVSDVDLR